MEEKLDICACSTTTIRFIVRHDNNTKPTDRNLRFLWYQVAHQVICGDVHASYTLSIQAVQADTEHQEQW